MSASRPISDIAPTIVDGQPDLDLEKNNFPPNPDTEHSAVYTDARLAQDEESDEALRREKEAKDPNIIDWDGHDDPENPLNWPSSRKWASMSVVGMMCFVSPLASTLLAPAMPKIAADFGITNPSIAALCVSIFVLAYAFGPLLASPLSEIHSIGRRPVLIGFMFVFFIFNIACAVAKTTSQLIVFRFFAGLGGAAPLTVGAGTLIDVFRPHERGRAMSLFSLGPLVGPVVGPIAGGFMADRVSVEWTLWLLVIITGVVLVLSIFLLRETYHPTLLQKKVQKLRKETGNKDLVTAHVAMHGKQDVMEVLTYNLARPIILFFTDPSCLLIGVYMAICYGYLYLMFTTFATVFHNLYGHSISISSLHYLGPGLGSLSATILAALTMDKVYMALTKRNNGVGKPEFRVPIMLFASIMMPSGLFIYGWCGEKRTHWIWLDIGSAVFGGGVIISFLALNTYLVDAFKYAASAIAASAVLRSIAGAFFPLFGEQMFEELGLGWGNSLLAFIALALGVTYPIFLWYYGPRIRAKGKSER